MLALLAVVGMLLVVAVLCIFIPLAIPFITGALGWLLLPTVIPFLIGHLQREMLRSYDPSANTWRAWKHANYISTLFVLPFSCLLPVLIWSNTLGDILLFWIMAALTLMTACIGLLTGRAQARAYAPLRAYAGWWAAATALGWGVSWLLGTRVFWILFQTQQAWLGVLFVLFVPWLCLGLITGTALVVLLRLTNASRSARQVAGQLTTGRFARLWLLGTAGVGTFAGLSVQVMADQVLYAFMMINPGNSLFGLLPLIIAVASSFSVGIVQALLVSRYAPGKGVWRRWSIASCIGGLLALPLFWYAVTVSTPFTGFLTPGTFRGGLVLLAVFPALIGLLTGWAQARTYAPLRPYMERWMFICALAWGVGWSLGMHLTSLLLQYMQVWLYANGHTLWLEYFYWIRMPLVLGLPWLLIAFITAVAMYVFLRKHSSQAGAGSRQSVP